MTAFLMDQIASILSERHEPRPHCPRCSGSHISSAGFKVRQVSRRPMFECVTEQVLPRAVG
ncbi:hypothetical protein CFB45_30785 [Burkholderia sp. HI2500]|nr:hypothetical protein CFB45_30785 [Burkholderia sp. HI2500]